MKGIILAGGKGARLFPTTTYMSKQLIPIYDKPMIYYPLSVLMLAGIRDILLISSPDHVPLFQKLFGNGSQLGIRIEYKIQDQPNGLAEAFILGEQFIGQDPVCLVLGDNIFYGHDLTKKLIEASHMKDGGMIFGYYLNDPSAFGVVSFDQNNNVLGVEEKPVKPKSNYAIPGLYFFDKNCIQFAKNTKPSARGELEITSVINQYIEKKMLKLERLGRGTAWLDTGTYEGLMQASSFVHTIEKRQGLKIACLEEIAYFKKFISLDGLRSCADKMTKSDYGQYLQTLIQRIENDLQPVYQEEV